MRRSIIGISFLLAMAVAGCSSSAQTSGPGGGGGSGATVPSGVASIPVVIPGQGNAPDPCKMLTKDEVGAAYGSPVAAGVPDIVNSCKWDGTPGSVSLHFLHISSAICSAASASRTPVPGLPVQASWHFIPAGSTGSIVACTNEWQVQVTIVGDIIGHTQSEATLQAAAKQLMGLVLGRM